ncbi:hypothetical protein FB558_3536 [Pseudonocardia kunmingensis]|uniref:Uncharacterized protein n=1 Tax=Pseudonocardia kunmingensis TaxID=630975 RepID=A0A543DNU4_9PSEU|nr:hypothetical protein FB558_3536 [Pseudonocardia kunmingensis]
MRFSDAELVLVQERAALAGLAVGAWIGQTVLDVAQRGDVVVSLGLPDLLRLHADVVLVERAASAGGVVDAQVGRLLARLDAVVDVVVAELDRARR